MSRRRTSMFVSAPARPAPTYPEYEELRVAAERSAAADGGFVDPVKMRRGNDLPRSWEWKARVLGHDGPSSLIDLHLLLLADDRDLDPPLPEWLAQARADAERRDAEKAAAQRRHDDRDQAEWEKALAGCAVEVTVLRNGHARPRGGYLHNLGHVVPKVDVESGPERRPRRHRAGRGLCETEQRANPLDLSGGEGGPATCVSCLDYTLKIRPAASPA